MSTESSTPRKAILQDVAFFGMRLAVGVVFLMAGHFKLTNPDILKQMVSMGLPVEFTTIISTGEFLGGIFLILGVLSRIGSVVISLVMLGVIFHIKWSSGYFGPDGWESDAVLLAGSLAFIVFGPKRISISHLVKRIPKFLQ